MDKPIYSDLSPRSTDVDCGLIPNWGAYIGLIFDKEYRILLPPEDARIFAHMILKTCDAIESGEIKNPITGKSLKDEATE